MPSSPRIYYLDHLRIACILLVLVFHNARFFDLFGDWGLKADQRSLPLSLLVIFVFPWIMPLIFAISGSAAGLSLQKRSSARYLKDRVLRLLVPYFFVALTFNFIQGYIVALNKGLYHGNFWEFIPWFIPRRPLHWDFSALGTYGLHLWFLAELFLFSLVTLPIFQSLRVPRIKTLPVIVQLRKLLERYPSLCLATAGVAVQILLHVRFSRFGGLADVLFWFIFFLFGFAFIYSPAIRRRLRQERMMNAFIGICCIGYFGLMHVQGQVIGWLVAPDHSIGFLSFQGIMAVNGVVWTLCILSLAEQYLNRDTSWRQYANEAVMPFYCIHQTMVFVAAYYLLPLTMQPDLHFLLLTVVSLALTLGSYELFIKRIGVLRLGFGMGSKTRKTP